MIPFGSRVFFDSDAFIGIIVEKDTHHKEALSLLRSIELSHGILVTSNLEIAETASTLSRRVGRNAAVNFLRFVHDTSFDVFYFTEELQNKSVELFYSLKKSKISLGTD